LWNRPSFTKCFAYVSDERCFTFGSYENGRKQTNYSKALEHLENLSKSSIDFTLDGLGAFSEQSLYKKDKENRGRRHNNLIRVGKGKERDNSRPYKSRKGGEATACIRGRLRVKKRRGK
jgi:hypothetical protein